MCLKRNLWNKKKIDKIFLILFLLIIFPSISFGQLKIMPLGDSITRGVTGSSTGGYRATLYNSLNAAGYNFDFVGSLQDGTVTDRDHEGHSGYETQQIRDNVIQWLNANPADIVLLHIGTNDVEFKTTTPSQIADYVNEILDNIDTYSTNTTVFLARIMLDVDDTMKTLGVNGPKATRTKDFNLALDAMAANRSSDRLIVVNIQDTLDYPDSLQTLPSPGTPVSGSDIYYDTNNTLLHPAQSGYDKIANKWFSAIQNYFTPGPLLPLVNDNTQPINPTLTWTASPIPNSSTRYGLQVSTDSTFSNLVFNNQNLTNTFAQITPNLNYGTKYYWRVNSKNFGGTSNWSSTRSFTTEPMQVRVKIFLQGPYISSTSPNMNTNLSGLTDFPKTQPYTGSPWNYGGNEIVTTVPSGVVDWVLVQLRTGTAASTAVKTRAAFLMSDGSIHDIGGSAYINFTGISSGNYYIVVKHRNHLAVMSSIAVALGDSSTLYDFTIAQTQAYGTNPMASLSGGKFGMYAGDTNGDGNITGTDFNLFNPDFIDGVSGYNAIDWNLDGNTTGSDFNIFNPNFINGKSSYVQ